MTARVLIDTNVLAYRRDRAAREKAALAEAACAVLAEVGQGLISTQVVCELYNALAVKMRDRVPFDSVLLSLELEIQTWPVVGITPEIAVSALERAGRDGLSIWDAQLLATAHYYRIPTVLSEDFTHRRDYDGVTVLNPFAEDFDVGELGPE